MKDLLIHCTDFKQVNSLLNTGWKLKGVRSSTPTGYGFVYVLGC
ncbi:hypothetical protein MKY15_20850 [Sporosarcina sp. FSL K6-1540]